MERKPSFSPSSEPEKRFDVFLSFRGEDTRNNFTGHLSLALRRIGLFNIFKDDYALDKGKDIGPELMSAIEDSRYAVIVLSKNYATSSWCLTEVAKIVECMGGSGRIRTIFYHVNPSHVRNVISTNPKKQQESDFWKALEEHAKNPSHSQHLESWRNALVTVANQSGYPVEDHMDEATFIEEFVTKISGELGASIRTMDGLVGMTSRLKELDSEVLQSNATNNKSFFIGIHGMGGIGKSTLAKAYYKRMSHKFDGSSFLENVREVCEKKTNGLVKLQRQLLSDILKSEFKEIGHAADGIDMIRSRLRSKKVLIILDDVNKEEQLNALANEENWFRPGSIIIVTSREDNFLKIRKYKIHSVDYLNSSEALQLFSSKAFQSIDPPEEYKKLSKEVVKYANCLPLALTVLGSLLGSKNKSEWKDAIHRLRKCPQKEIIGKLKISFDDLSEADQCIFLDVACFFNAYSKKEVVQIMDSCGFDPEYGISNLIDKSLLSIKHGSKLWMHDLLQQMGRDIVQQKAGNEQARQSRIWDANDLHDVLEHNEGTNKVEAIVTFHYGIQAFSFGALSSMRKLRLLMILGYPRLGEGPDFEYLSNDLRFIQWNEYHYNGFPLDFHPPKLVQLKLPGSKIERLWNNRITQPLTMLKVIDLSNSRDFSKFDDFKVVPNLERLILEGCTELSVIDPSIKVLQRLTLLNLKFCTSLGNLPEEISSLASLETLNLNGCGGLHKLPDNLEHLKSLRELDMRTTGIKYLPYSIFLMENLESVSVSSSYQEEMVESAIRESISNYPTIGKCYLFPASLCSLERLNLTDCKLTDESFPEYFGKLLRLELLVLNQNPFSALPPCIKGLSHLTCLSLENCEHLQCLDSELLPSSLEEVYVNYCTSLSSFLDPSYPCHIGCSAFCLDCFELVQRQDGTQTALVYLATYLNQSPFNRRGRFEIVLPLDLRESYQKLSSWFNEISSTDSISIHLDPNRGNCKLKGVTMVFFSEPNSSPNEFFCHMRVGRSQNWETTMKEYRISLLSINTRNRRHLSLLYRSRESLPTECIDQLESISCDTVEFLFCSDEYNICLCNLCGVRLVYEEDMFKETTSTDCGQFLHQEDHLDSLQSESFSELQHLNLEDNLELAEEKQDSVDTTLTPLKKFVEVGPNPEGIMETVTPFVIIPSFFRAQSLGSSASTKLFPNWCNIRWMGICLFLCFPAKIASNNFSCVISFLGENLEVRKESLTETGSSFDKYIWILYLTRDYFPVNWLQNSFGNMEFSFHARTLFKADSCSSCCGPCGLRLVYKKDLEILIDVMKGKHI